MATTILGKVSVTPAGDYDAKVMYEPLDIVRYNGASYIVRRNVVGVTPTDGEDYMLIIKDGEPGSPGNSIQSINRTAGTGTSGTTDTYTVTLTDGSTTEFYVYNGKDGIGAGDMTTSVYDPQGKAQDIFKYVDDSVSTVSSGVESFNGRSGTVMPSNDDYTADMVGAADRILSNLTDPAAALVNIGAAASNLSNVSDEDMLAKLEATGFSGGGAASGENLLDNGYFLDPINQRGIALDTEFSDVGQYFIDRWILIDGTVMLTANGLVLNGTIRQKREAALNTDFAASVFASSGTATAEYDDTLMYFDITSDGGTIVAAKLEVGTVSTIKRQDADGNWVLNDPPPNKTLELAKCQRYFWRYHVPIYHGFALGLAQDDGAYMRAPIRTPVEMRAAPVVTFVDGYIGASSNKSVDVHFSLVVRFDWVGKDVFTISLSKQDVTFDGSYILQAVGSNGMTIDVSADL